MKPGKPRPEDKAARKLRRIRAACVMLERQAEAIALETGVPFGEKYGVPCPRGADGKPGFPPHIALAVIEGWQVLYSIVKHADHSEQRNGSAMLHPHGRSSTLEDWKTLATIASITSHGDDGCMRQLARQSLDSSHHPNSPQHWCWFVNVPEDKLPRVRELAVP